MSFSATGADEGPNDGAVGSRRVRLAIQSEQRTGVANALIAAAEQQDWSTGSGSDGSEDHEYKSMAKGTLKGRYKQQKVGSSDDDYENVEAPARERPLGGEGSSYVHVGYQQQTPFFSQTGGVASRPFRGATVGRSVAGALPWHHQVDRTRGSSRRPDLDASDDWELLGGGRRDSSSSQTARELQQLQLQQQQMVTDMLRRSIPSTPESSVNTASQQWKGAAHDLAVPRPKKTHTSSVNKEANSAEVTFPLPRPKERTAYTKPKASKSVGITTPAGLQPRNSSRSRGEAGGYQEVAEEFAKVTRFRGEGEGEGEYEDDGEHDDEVVAHKVPTRAERRLESAGPGVGFVLKWIMAPMMVIGFCLLLTSSSAANEQARHNAFSQGVLTGPVSAQPHNVVRGRPSPVPLDGLKEQHKQGRVLMKRLHSYLERNQARLGQGARAGGFFRAGARSWAHAHQAMAQPAQQLTPQQQVWMRQGQQQQQEAPQTAEVTQPLSAPLQPVMGQRQYQPGYPQEAYESQRVYQQAPQVQPRPRHEHYHEVYRQPAAPQQQFQQPQQQYQPSLPA